VPRWATELTSKYPTFNARSETVTEKNTFKNSVVRSRAILPADGYYEWHTVGTTKTPHFITDPVAGELAFAGLYSWWRAPVSEGAEPGPWVLTATMLTRAAHGPAASIHDRAPVMLPREVWDEWLDPTVEGDQSLVDMIVAESETVLERLEFHAVAPLRGDGPQLIEPL
jgi:putative SOS response-associated peptidase YedK